MLNQLNFNPDFWSAALAWVIINLLRGLFHLLCREPYISATPGPTEMILYAKERADSALNVLFY